jgi:hypothetical protein
MIALAEPRGGSKRHRCSGRRLGDVIVLLGQQGIFS